MIDKATLFISWLPGLCGERDVGAETSYAYLKNSLARNDAPYLNEGLLPSGFRASIPPVILPRQVERLVRSSINTCIKYGEDGV